MDLIEVRKKTDELKSMKSLIVKQLEAGKLDLSQAKTKAENVSEAKDIVLTIAEGIQAQVHKQVANLVTRCLQAVFGSEYRFDLIFEKKRGRSSARFVLTKEGQEYDDLLNEVGGGVVDVVSFGLRLSCVLLARPERRRLLVLDEPFKNLRGIEYRRRLRRMLKELSERLDFQFIINVDHQAYPEFVLGKVIEVGSDGQI